jgi:hypothetical protein
MARTSRPKQYDHAIALIKKELGITDVSISWRAKLNKGIAGFARRYEVVILKNMSYSFTIFALAHELRHVYQKQNNLFVPRWNKDIKEYDIYWKPTDTLVSPPKGLGIYRGKNQEGYKELPWEVDANIYGENFQEMYLDKYGYNIKERVEPVYFSNGNLNYKQTAIKAHNENKDAYVQGCDKDKMKRTLKQLGY